VRDEVVVEAPLELRLGSTPIAVVMRTPGMDEDLALGFALTEGIVLRPSEIGAVRPVGPDRLELVPAEGVEIDPEQFRRNLYATSSCGVCGKASIDAVRITSPRLPAGPVLSPAMVSSLPDRLRAAQPTFDATGGIHAAGIFDPDGTLLAAAEDVGRHNAVDKAIGRAARLRWPLGEVVLAVSGRASFEVAQKAAVGGIPLIAGVSAASSLAAELADELGMTLVGFTRDAGFVVYAGAARVFPDTPASSFV
jgi:FdhD protein